MTSNSNISLSCEFFPPRTEQALANFREAYRKLQALKPAFFSVTFGAGGSTQDKTFDTVAELMRETGVETAPHLSCITASRAEIRDMLRAYQAQGVRRIVALRGDRPSGMGLSDHGDFRHAAELVRFIREETGEWFFIEVAAYPEFHPQAASAPLDLRYFKEKAKAGANGAITQYFYNPEAYFRLLDSARKLGVDIPIVPGIMPITNYTQLARFSDACGAEIPRWLRKRLEAFGEDRAGLQAFGAEVVSAMCRRLLDGGAPGLHFYTLNRAEAVLEIVSGI
jgi:methylenetetrahydrofolate reductase (NADPH)